MGKGGPVGAVVSAVASVPAAVVDATKDAGQGALNVVTAIPKTVAGIVSGDNVGQSLFQGATSIGAGIEALPLAAVTVANTVTPTGVQELPIVNTVEQLRAADVNIGQGDTSKGAYENFYRSGAEVAAVAVTAGAAGGAFSAGDVAAEGTLEGSTALAPTIGETSAATIGGSTAEEGGALVLPSLDTAAGGEAVTAGSASSGLLGLGGAESYVEAGVGASVLGSTLKAGEKALAGAVPGLGSVLGVQTGTTKTIVKPGPNASGISSGGDVSPLGMSAKQASGLVAAGLIVAVLYKKGIL